MKQKIITVLIVLLFIGLMGCTETSEKKQDQSKETNIVEYTEGQTKCVGFDLYTYVGDQWVLTERNCPSCGYVSPYDNEEYISFITDTNDNAQYYNSLVKIYLDDLDYDMIAYYGEKAYYFLYNAMLENNRYDVSNDYKDLQEVYHDYLDDAAYSYYYMYHGAEYASWGEYSTATTYFETATDLLVSSTNYLEEATDLVEYLLES